MVGGIKNWDRKFDPDRADAPLQPKPDKQGSPDVIGRAKELAIGAMLKGSSAVVGEDGAPVGAATAATNIPEEPIGSFARGGMVKKKRPAGARRLAYADGGLVLKKDEHLSAPLEEQIPNAAQKRMRIREPTSGEWDVGTIDERMRRNREIFKTGVRRIKT
jgi:hypothetical protein